MRCLLILLFVGAFANQLQNESPIPSSTSEPINETEPAPEEVKDCVDHGDTAMMMVATTFVMLQTPAMGIAQAGMIRRKNSLSMLMQTFTGFVLGSVLWFLFGYSLTFSTTSGGIIGDFNYSFFRNVPIQGCFDGQTIPAYLFISFQMMFAVMTPVIVTGSWAEKMTFKAFLVFVTLWPILVYYPLAHWIWNSGGWLFKYGTLDFAGGIVIHTAAGVAGLVVAYFLQRRKELRHGLNQAHNLPLSILGGSLIWAGWYFFNGGSAIVSGSQAGVVLLNTHLSACTSACVWTICKHLEDGKWHLTEIISGALAGLAAITPGSGFVLPYAAFVIGIIAGFISWGSVRIVKGYFRLDDVLDVFALQGAPGIVGSLLVGFFANVPFTTAEGIFYGGGGLLFRNQVVGVLVSIAWSGFWTAVLMIVMKWTVGIDVTPEVEEMGLDEVQVGDQAYDEKLNLVHDLGPVAAGVKLIQASRIGDLNSVREMLQSGADVNFQDYDSRTAAHLAAAEGHLPVLQILLKYSADFNKRDRHNRTPLGDAISHSQDAVVEWLRANGAQTEDSDGWKGDFFQFVSSKDEKGVKRLLIAGVSPNITDYDSRTPLMVAAADGFVEIAKLLLDYGADAKLKDRWDKTAADEAMFFKQDAILQLFSSNSPSEMPNNATSPSSDDEEDRLKAVESGKKSANNVVSSTLELCEACSAGDMAEIKRLLKKGANPSAGDYDGRTPLHIAVSSRQLEVVKYLLSLNRTVVSKKTAKGTSTRQMRINVNAMDRWKRTPLSDALAAGDAEIANLLRSQGASIVSKGMGSKLCQAAAKGDIDELREMSAHGVDVNMSDYDGRTALHLAAAEGHIVVVRYLLSLGAKVESMDRYGGQPFDDAARNGHLEIAELVRPKITSHSSLADLSTFENDRVN